MTKTEKAIYMDLLTIVEHELEELETIRQNHKDKRLTSYQFGMKIAYEDMQTYLKGVLK